VARRRQPGPRTTIHQASHVDHSRLARLWGPGDFVFISGQLQNLVKRKHTQPIGGGGMPMMREAFLQVWKTVPNTGMAVACDIGDTGTHFKNKKESGRRLALAALGIAYGREIVYSGPICDSMKVEGATISLQFKHVGSGLKLDQRGEFSGFAIAGKDKAWYWADVKIDGESLIVSSAKVAEPAAVPTPGTPIRASACSTTKVCPRRRSGPTSGSKVAWAPQ